MMTGPLDLERAMEVAVKPNASTLGERLVAGEVVGRAGRAGGGGGLARVLSRATAAGEEMRSVGAWTLLMGFTFSLPKKNVRESARRRGDLMAFAAAAVLRWTGLSGGVNESRSIGKALVESKAVEERKVGEETLRVLVDAEEDSKEEAAEVAGEGVLLR